MAELSPVEKMVCTSFGISELAYRRSKAAIAAGKPVHEVPGMLRAHQEVDRAHDAAQQSDHQDRVGNTPDAELLKSAISELQAFKPDDDNTYDRLLNGCLYAMRLLNRAAPAYADADE